MDKAHGRLEVRTLEAATALNDDLAWPGLQQVIRRRTRRTRRTAGTTSEEVCDGLTNLPRDLAGAAHLEALWRAHRIIENRVHSVRDVTFGEDASRIRVGPASQAFTAFPNAIISLCRPAV
ncbi:MAG TPA: hypothetical protein DEP84_30345 [Chloroflexi bacterium]|nr:hypothetical protein [Chloroflexota bacterium]